MAVSSPAYHYADPPISLDRVLVRNAPATIYVRMQGDAMREDGIWHNDLLMVDRNLTPISGVVVLVVLAETLLAMRWVVAVDGSVSLVVADPTYLPLRLTEDSPVTVIGVVTCVIRPLIHGGRRGLPSCPRAAGHLPLGYV